MERYIESFVAKTQVQICDVVITLLPAEPRVHSAPDRATAVTISLKHIVYDNANADLETPQAGSKTEVCGTFVRV